MIFWSNSFDLLHDQSLLEKLVSQYVREEYRLRFLLGEVVQKYDLFVGEALVGVLFPMCYLKRKLVHAKLYDTMKISLEVDNCCMFERETGVFANVLPP